MYTRMEQNLYKSRSFRVGIAFALFALIIGVYFLFRPFPAGPSLDVKANFPEVPVGKVAASVAGSYANHTASLKDQWNIAPASAAEAIQRFGNGASSVLEDSSKDQWNIAPASAAEAIQRYGINPVFTVDSSAQPRIEVDSATSAAYLQRFGIEAVYVAEASSQDSTSSVLRSSLLADDAASARAYLRRFGIDPDSGKITSVP